MTTLTAERIASLSDTSFNIANDGLEHIAPADDDFSRRRSILVLSLPVPSINNEHAIAEATPLIGHVVNDAAYSTLGGGHWQFSSPSGNWILWVKGVEMNPTPVNGKTYRTFNRNGSPQWLVRYNDDDHREDRHNRSNPYSIVGGPYGAHYSASDSLVIQHPETPELYAEVVPRNSESPSATPNTLDDLLLVANEQTAVEAEAEAEAPVPNTIVGHALDRLYGKAEVTEHGVLLSPEREVGGHYLVWGESPTPYHCIWQGEGKQWVQVARLSAARYFDNDPGLREASEQDVWAKLNRTHGEPSPDPDTVRRLTERAATERAALHNFSVDLNRLARQNDWCSEYEGIVQRVGLPGRVDGDESDDGETEHDYEVTVRIEGEFSMDSVPSAVDSTLTNLSDGSLDLSSVSMNSASFTGTMLMTMRVTELGHEPTSDDIDEDDITEAFNGEHSHMTLESLDSWSIYSFSQVDD